MDYYGLLFLYYLKGLSGKSVLRLFFNVEVGGTEQLLPENTSTPTTTPILADIQYPDGLRTDQYFTYRETPTTITNKARIKAIKGQTLKWNQLAKVTESFTSATSNGVTLSRVDDHLHIQGTATSTATFNSTVNCNEDINFPPAHKFLLSINPKNINVLFGIKGYGLSYFAPAISVVRPSSETTDWQGVFQFRVDSGVTVNDDLYLQAFDLTAMGIADKTDAEILQWFADYFPLSNYSFNSGSLIPFNGNGIKTVGKNLFDETKYQNLRSTYDYYDSGYYCRTIQLLPNTEYTISQRATTTSSVVLLLNKYSHVNESGFFDCRNAGGTKTYVTDSSGCLYIGIYANNSNAEANQRLAECQLQIEHGSTATAYEPYTSSTLSLPISTYFPNGMDGVGSDYDELTNTKATTRMARVDLGTLDYTYEQQNSRLFTLGLANVIKKQGQYDLPNIIVPNYTVRYVYQISAENNMSVGVSPTSGAVFFSNANYTSGTDFKTAMSGIYLVYPLATPTETPITTEDANEALSLLMGKSVSSNNANQLIDIITKGE